MPENSTIIEELLRGFNQNFDRQLTSLELLTKKFEEAEKRGSSAEFMSLLSREMGKIENSINAQKDMMGSVYKEVSDRASKRGETVNPEVIKDIYGFIKELAEKQNKVNQLKGEYNSKGKYTREEKQEISKKIRELKDDIKNSRLAKLDEYKGKYQKGSAELEALKKLSVDKKIKETAEDISTIEEGQEVNLRNIYRAQEANNRQLEKTEKFWGLITESARIFWNQVKDGGNLWLKYNAQAISDAKRLGMTSKEEAIGYMNTLMENSKTLARNFGMTAEQAMKMQDVYVKVTGRAAMLTTSQMEDIAAASKLMGEETVQSAMGIMDKMGSTSQTTMELMDKNFVRAANSGLDTVKASEEFVKNMSLANKLNFRNGVDGISKMTILSQRIKMNLGEVANVAEKFSTIEGAIEGSARLQVLGGAGALYGSNPMQMMYEALSDPEALYNRMGKMFSQQAVFDRRTGESRIDPLQMAIMREQAKAMGMNPDVAIQSAKQQAKLNAIESDFRTYASTVYTSATEPQKAAIQNKAEYDKEKQTWVVKYLDEAGEEQVADIKNLTQEQLESITKDNAEDVKDIRAHVRKIAMALVGTKERWESMKDQWKTGNAQGLHGVMSRVDSFLTTINNSGFWKILTTGSFAAMVARGMGVTTTTLGWNYLKIVSAKIAKNLISSIVTGKSASISAKAASSMSTVAEGANVASQATNAYKAGSKIKNLRRLSKARQAIRGISGGIKAGGRIAAPLAIVTELGMAGWDYYQAGQERKTEEQMIKIREQSVNKITGRNRFSAHEIEQQRIKADNIESEAKGKAIGSGTGALVGAGIGFLVGGPLGASIGAALGGMAGGYIGGKAAPEKQGDVIAQHLKDIEKGDEEENFRRIVLPVESIDYNVSLIANQLGILSATPARNNVYLNAESNDDISVESTPLEASKVNNVDSSVLRTSDMYQPKGPITLNVNGSIDLNMKGTNVGKLTAKDFKDMFDSNPELRRYIIESISKGIAANGNGAREFKELSQNRLNSQGSTNFIS